MSNGQIPDGNGDARMAEERHAYGIRSVTNRGRTGSAGLSLVDMARAVGEDILDLLSSQLRLARLGLASDIKRAIGPAAALVLFIPIAFLGYAFGLAAVTSWLSTLWGLTMALGIVAASQLVVGLSGGWLALRRLRGRRVLERASSELGELAENVRATLGVVVTQPSRSVDD